MKFLIVLYLLTAFVWAVVDSRQRKPSLKTMGIFIGRFVGFPFFVIKEKLNE